MIWERETETFIRKFVTELDEENAAVFAGAGLSRAAGYVDWAMLLQDIAKDLGLDAYKESDLVSLAQFHVNSHGDNRSELSQLLVDKFSDLKDPSPNHHILARLPIPTYWTTNYDRLIENALERRGKVVDTKFTVPNLTTTRRGRDVVLYKMHGDIGLPSKAILTRHDYESYHVEHAPFIEALRGDLVEKTFLFLGFSFTDPNLNYVLSRVRVHFRQDQRQHYCVMKRRSREPNESDDEFEYAGRRQTLQLADLRRFNIVPIVVDNYSEITDLLKLIEQRHRLRTIFLSGSAAHYGDWGQGPTEAFLMRLADVLISKNLRLSTGFGLGIGGAVIAGALKRIYADNDRRVDKQLIMRPFPAVTAAAEPDNLERYRRELIAEAGIAIFFMGNKEQDGKIVAADGMRHEFLLARENNLSVIPIGASGHEANRLSEEVLADLGSFYAPSQVDTVRPLLKALAEPTTDPMELLEPLLKLIHHLTGV